MARVAPGRRPCPWRRRGPPAWSRARRPIVVRCSAEVGRRRPTYEETPRGVTTNASANLSRETKPIGTGIGLMLREDSACQAPPRADDVGRGRPTLDQVEDRPYEEPPEGGTPNESCETKPIAPERNDMQVLVGGRVMTNQTHTGPRQNKANCRTDSRGHGAVRLAAPVGPVVRNKANLPRTGRKRRWRRWGKRAKQSQFLREQCEG